MGTQSTWGPGTDLRQNRREKEISIQEAQHQGLLRMLKYVTNYRERLHLMRQQQRFSTSDRNSLERNLKCKRNENQQIKAELIGVEKTLVGYLKIQENNSRCSQNIVK